MARPLVPAEQRARGRGIARLAYRCVAGLRFVFDTVIVTFMIFEPAAKHALCMHVGLAACLCLLNGFFAGPGLSHYWLQRFKDLTHHDARTELCEG